MLISCHKFTHTDEKHRLSVLSPLFFFFKGNILKLKLQAGFTSHHMADMTGSLAALIHLLANITYNYSHLEVPVNIMSKMKREKHITG